MKRQVSLILALACKPKYLLLDEAFDGLDPVIRGAVRKILADQIAERDMTVIIASHNLRELEDLCDHIGLLHLGKIVFEREIDESKLGFCKVQMAFRTPPQSSVFDRFEILQRQDTGSITTLIVRGKSDEAKAYLESQDALLVESVPLTLEEVFIYEMEAAGYDYANIIF
jgi:ABC-2 type transport system ATP-binding protein